MVKDLKNVLAQLTEAGKPVRLFAALKMDELIDRWSIIVSAPWITAENHSDSFKEIVDLLIESLDSSDLSLVARVNLLGKDDHLVAELLKRKAGDVIKEEKVNGNIVHEGIIVESKPEL